MIRIWRRMNIQGMSASIFGIWCGLGPHRFTLDTPVCLFVRFFLLFFLPFCRTSSFPLFSFLSFIPAFWSSFFSLMHNMHLHVFLVNCLCFLWSLVMDVFLSPQVTTAPMAQGTPHSTAVPVVPSATTLVFKPVQTASPAQGATTATRRHRPTIPRSVMLGKRTEYLTHLGPFLPLPLCSAGPHTSHGSCEENG